MLAGDDGQLSPRGVRQQGLRRAAHARTSISTSPRPRTALPTGRHAALPPEIIEYTGFNALLAELEAFAGAIRGGAPYPIPPEQMLHGVAVFEAIVQSAATHQPVKVARD